MTVVVITIHNKIFKKCEWFDKFMSLINILGE